MAWYEVKGNETDVVFSSRIRFARNLSGYAFGAHLSEKSAREIIDRTEAALGKESFSRTDMEKKSPTEAAALVESHLISRDFAAAKGPRALFTDDNRSLSLMVCEEDHIRLQCILPGLSLRDAFRFATECDDVLDATLPIAFDSRWGYLTHCPTNLGTGMRASVMLFLPALSEAGMISSLAHRLSKIGLTMRGIYGEGSKSHGALYQVSNQVTLGATEEEILNKLENAVQSIIESERRLRREVKGEAAERRRDRIHRAEGTARFATLISSSEFFRLFADLKLGVALGEITSITDGALNALLVHTQPATLTASCEGEAPRTEVERDRLRAALIKKAWEVTKNE